MTTLDVAWRAITSIALVFLAVENYLRMRRQRELAEAIRILTKLVFHADVSAKKGPQP